MKRGRLTGRSPEERFWFSVDRRGDDECWPWTAHTIGNGYGQFMVNKKLTLVHRFSYELHRGPIPEGMDCLHSCDNPGCCNPNHLFLGTHDDNMKDKTKKGRAPSMPGEDNPFSKLTEQQVREIREKYVNGVANQYELAAEYGVTQALVWLIVNRRVWKHVE